jgi:hypothetical protein
MSEAAAERKFLTPDEILAADDRKFLEVEIPEWGGWVRFRQMTAAEAIEFTDSINKPGKTNNNGMVRIVAACLVDENGKRMFTDLNMDKLKSRNIKVFLRAQKTLLEFNGFKDEEQQIAAVAAAKND